MSRVYGPTCETETSVTDSKRRGTNLSQHGLDSIYLFLLTSDRRPRTQWTAIDVEHYFNPLNVRGGLRFETPECGNIEVPGVVSKSEFCPQFIY